MANKDYVNFILQFVLPHYVTNYQIFPFVTKDYFDVADFGKKMKKHKLCTFPYSSFAGTGKNYAAPVGLALLQF